ncbi:hypothetical protein TNCV_2858721 [Trichonephila clavipes]|nr:hypothetical protein TNCV_2858721 [Trichonephila clavipes]
MFACGREFNIACMSSKSLSYKLQDADHERDADQPNPTVLNRWKLYGHSKLCRAGVNRRALTSPSVVHCQFFKLVSTRRSTASKLVSLWNYSTAHKLLLRDRKILLLEGR